MSVRYDIDLGGQYEKKKIYIYGTSSLGILKLIDSINNIRPTWDIIGFIENNKLTSRTCGGYPVVDLGLLLDDQQINGDIYVANNQKDNSREGIDGLDKLLKRGFRSCNIIHPNIDLNRVTIGRGCVLSDGCIIGGNTKLGNFITCELRALVSHDVYIEDQVYIGLGACIGGGAKLKKRCYISIGAIVMGNVTIGEGSIVGPGAVVNKDVKPNTIVAGVPAKLLKRDNEWIN